jgi:N-acetylglutamate synthase-like GNAT family acetyltransferase
VPPSLDTYLGALPERPDSYFIHDMTLDSSVQRRNLATELMPEIFRAARGAGLSRIALVAVNGSTPFWSRMGFRRTADESVQELVRAKYDADAIHMEQYL